MLLGEARVALEEAKQRGRGKVVVSSPELHRRRANRPPAFSMQFEPVVSLCDGSISTYSATVAGTVPGFERRRRVDVRAAARRPRANDDALAHRRRRFVQGLDVATPRPSLPATRRRGRGSLLARARPIRLRDRGTRSVGQQVADCDASSGGWGTKDGGSASAGSARGNRVERAGDAARAVHQDRRGDRRRGRPEAPGNAVDLRRRPLVRGRHHRHGNRDPAGARARARPRIRLRPGPALRRTSGPRARRPASWADHDGRSRRSGGRWGLPSRPAFNGAGGS